MLIDEARLAAGAHHPNVVGARDLGVDDGRYYVVLELVPGGTRLVDLLAGGHPPVEVAVQVAAEIARGLAYLHHTLADSRGRPLGVVHRDLGPSNVLVGPAGEVRVTDFGVAKASLRTDDTAGALHKGTS